MLLAHAKAPCTGGEPEQGANATGELPQVVAEHEPAPRTLNGERGRVRNLVAGAVDGDSDRLALRERLNVVEVDRILPVLYRNPPRERVAGVRPKVHAERHGVRRAGEDPSGHVNVRVPRGGACRVGRDDAAAHGETEHRQNSRDPRLT